MNDLFLQIPRRLLPISSGGPGISAQLKEPLVSHTADLAQFSTSDYAAVLGLSD